MNVTHHTMVLHLCVNYSMILSKDIKAAALTQSYVKNPKVNVVSGLCIFATHPLMVIHPCAKYDITMSKQTEVTGST